LAIFAGAGQCTVLRRVTGVTSEDKIDPHLEVLIFWEAGNVPYCGSIRRRPGELIEEKGIETRSVRLAHLHGSGVEQGGLDVRDVRIKPS
jgi:hypothetical protein